MTIDQRIECLKQARRLVAEAVADCGIPQLEASLRETDMNLHWALWNMGEIEELIPDLEKRTEN